MHLLERPDLGHSSMIYYDGKPERKRLKEKKSSVPGFEPSTRRVLYRCAPTAANNVINQVALSVKI